MTKDNFISAQVSSRLLETVSRMFSGTVKGRITELLQNARRAGATKVHIKNTFLRPGVYTVTVEDNGVGVKDFAALLDAGRTEWGEDTQAAEDPAGMGVFSLSPRTTMITSHDQVVCIEGDGWMGMPVPIRSVEDRVKGTRFEFEDEQWHDYEVRPCAKYSGLTVYVDGEVLDTIPFMNTEKPVRHIPELGVRLQIFEEKGRWYSNSRFDINFFGQVIQSSALDKMLPTDVTLKNPRRHTRFAVTVLVELTGEPTDLRMILPAREDIVVNKAAKQLGTEIEKEYYRYIKTLAEHSLPYASYMRAHQLGIELEESAIVLYDTFRSFPSNWHGRDSVIFQIDNPIKIHFEAREFTDGPAAETDYVDEEAENIVSELIGRSVCEDGEVYLRTIQDGYEKYSWAKEIPVGKELTINIGPTLFEHDADDIGWQCVERITFELELENGEKMTGDLQYCPSADFNTTDYTAEGSFMVTKDFLRTHGSSDVLSLLEMDCLEEDDRESFHSGYEQFSSLRQGEHEYHRDQIVTKVSRSVIDIADDYDKPRYWKSVHINNDGTVTITYNDDSEFVMKKGL